MPGVSGVEGSLEDTRGGKGPQHGSRVEAMSETQGTPREASNARWEGPGSREQGSLSH